MAHFAATEYYRPQGKSLAVQEHTLVAACMLQVQNTMLLKVGCVTL